MTPMSATTSRIYNTTDGPLIVDAEGHVLAAHDSTRVKSVDDEPVAGHIEAGRLIDTTEADDSQTKGDKPATKNTRS